MYVEETQAEKKKKKDKKDKKKGQSTISKKDLGLTENAKIIME
jgi:hypothetical protein